jgi:hypothetical protein
MRKGIVVTVNAADRSRLEAVVANRNSPQKHAWRCRIVVLTADGLGTAAIMQQTGKSKSVAGVDGLLRDKTRPARIPPLAQPVIDRVVALTSTDPPGETTHWTAAAMAKAAGISVSSVQRIWRAHGLEPHRIRQFKLSNDKAFADKLRKIVGLYVDPPAHAVVLSVDEKSQIQALDRTQPGLPIKKGRRGTMTHDYIRNGTTTLFAALNVLEGKSLPPRRRGSSAAACNVTGIRSSSASSMPSKPRSPPARSSMSSSTTTPPISIRTSKLGWRAIRASSPDRHQPLHRRGQPGTKALRLDRRPR